MTGARVFDPASVGEPSSYSTRPRRETSAEVVRNRAGVTGLLFGVAVGLSYLLGRD